MDNFIQDDTVKITKRQLRRIIREEKQRLLREDAFDDYWKLAAKRHRLGGTPKEDYRDSTTRAGGGRTGSTTATPSGRTLHGYRAITRNPVRSTRTWTRARREVPITIRMSRTAATSRREPRRRDTRRTAARNGVVASAGETQ